VNQRREFDFIDQIRRRQRFDSRAPIGIGDDTALLLGGPNDWLATVDMLIEDVHFTRETPARLIGRKALGVNLSDIAAMAGKPVAALVALGIPTGLDDHWLDELWRGIEDLAHEFHVAIVGGDTNRSKSSVVVSITLLGHPTGTGPVKRSGAQPGDKILVTGRLGGSLAGRHLTFRPRVEEAQKLHQLVHLHAMMDLSDGLGGDIFHLSRESECGMIIDNEAIPIHSDVKPDERSPLEHAFHDGEDFELLFTVSPIDADLLTRTQPLGETPITIIGEVSKDRGVFCRSKEGRVEAIPPGGFVHRW
jgi:thiamine-monophosphate kinase